MAIPMSDRIAIIEHLKQWAINTVGSCGLEAIYLFGSILYNDGELFQLSVSDIDLLALFADSQPTPYARALACQQLAVRIQGLESELVSRWLKTTKRDTPMVSAGAVTKYEMDRGVNIAGDPLFASWNIFLNLVTGKNRPEHEAATTPQWEVYQVLSKCQDCRKKFLGADGKEKLGGVTGHSAFLKTLYRSVAIYQDRIEKEMEKRKTRYDPITGKVRVRYLLAKNPALLHTIDVVEYRSDSEIPPFEQLQLWELAASDAMGELQDEPQKVPAPVIPKVSLRRPSGTLRRYSFGPVTCESLRLVGSAGEYFSPDVVHITYDPASRYTVPERIAESYDLRLGRLQATAISRNYPFFDGANTRLLRPRWTPTDSSEVNHIYLHLGPVGWYDYSVVADYVRECRETGNSDALKALGDLEDIQMGLFEKTRLTNILCTNTTLVTNDGFVLFAERKRVSATPDMYGAAVSENIHPEKDASLAGSGVPDPFRTVLRGVAEELSPIVTDQMTPADVIFLGVTFDLELLSPALLFLGNLPMNLEEVLAACGDQPGKDFLEGVIQPLRHDPEEFYAVLEKAWEAEGKASVVRALEFLGSTSNNDKLSQTGFQTARPAIRRWSRR
jgi:hypothetical protein